MRITASATRSASCSYLSPGWLMASFACTRADTGGRYRRKDRNSARAARGDTSRRLAAWPGCPAPAAGREGGAPPERAADSHLSFDQGQKGAALRLSRVARQTTHSFGSSWSRHLTICSPPLAYSCASSPSLRPARSPVSSRSTRMFPPYRRVRPTVLNPSLLRWRRPTVDRGSEEGEKTVGHQDSPRLQRRGSVFQSSRRHRQPWSEWRLRSRTRARVARRTARSPRARDESVGIGIWSARPGSVFSKSTRR